MPTQTQIAQEFVDGIVAQAANHGPNNALIRALTRDKGSPGRRLAARAELGQNPDPAEIEPLYNSIKSAIDTRNAAVVISYPTLAEVQAAIAAGTSAE